MPGPARRLPHLDISALADSTVKCQASLQSLRETAHDLGFFYLSGHGIAQDLIDQVLRLSVASSPCRKPTSLKSRCSIHRTSGVTTRRVWNTRTASRTGASR